MAFRNVKSILDTIGTELDHAPRTVDVRESRLDIVNRHYLDTSTSRDWTNLQTDVDWSVWANRTSETTGFTVSVTNGSATIVFSGALEQTFIEDAGGMVFEDGLGNSFTINRFTTTSTAFLDKAYNGATNAALSGWTIRAERFYLPRDCTKALGFVNEKDNLGRMIVLDRRMAEFAFGAQPDNEGTVYWIIDDDEIYDRPPDPGYSAVDNTALGSLLPNALYEVCYTFTLQGRESPPSLPIRVTTSSAVNHQINLSSLEDTQVGGVNTAVYKRVYIRLLTKDSGATDVYSRWLMVVELPAATTSYSITAFPNPTATELYYTNGRKYMSTQWIPSKDSTLRLRYLKCPPRLVADSDAPKWPEAFHDLLVFASLVDLGLQHSQPSGKVDRWQKRADDLLGRFAAAKTNVPDSPSRRRMRALAPQYAGLYRVNGTVTGDGFSG